MADAFLWLPVPDQHRLCVLRCEPSAYRAARCPLRDYGADSARLPGPTSPLCASASMRQQSGSQDRLVSDSQAGLPGFFSSPTSTVYGGDIIQPCWGYTGHAFCVKRGERRSANSGLRSSRVGGMPLGQSYPNPLVPKCSPNAKRPAQPG